MEFVDSHCHIQSVGVSAGEHSTQILWAKAPDLTADNVIASAIAAGTTKMVCVGCELADSLLAVAFVKGRPNCWASVGIHPHEAQHYSGKWDDLAVFSELADNKKVIAIGECGLDYFYEHSPRAAQIELLKFQIELALDRQLPLIFHVREAFDDFWPIFDSYKGIRGVIHSFTDNALNLDEALKRGLYIGVNGVATFAKSSAQQDVYRAIPLQKLLLETDAPFLTPTPYRGNINEPKRVGTIAKCLAELRGERLEQLAVVTTSNAHTLFGI